MAKSKKSETGASVSEEKKEVTGLTVLRCPFCNAIVAKCRKIKGLWIEVRCRKADCPSNKRKPVKLLEFEFH